MGKDYYKVLGVDKSASEDEIKKAFRKKAHECHPDKAGGDEAKFKEINEAYQVLGDQKKRAQYDQFGSSFEHAQGAGGFHGFEGFRDFSNFSQGFNINMDDLGDMFGGMGDVFGFGGQRKGGRKRGVDINAILSISFLEAVFGTEKEVEIMKKAKCGHCAGSGSEPGAEIKTCKTCGGHGQVRRVQRTIFGQMQVETTCSDCEGQGRVSAKKCSKCSGLGVIKERARLKIKIPAGIDTGGVIRLSGQGEAGAKGAPSGDLYLEIRVAPDKRWRREGINIFSRAEISFAQAALGDKIEIETVDGPVELKIPEGTQSGTSFRLKGRGVSEVNGRERGDHFVEAAIRTPKNLSRKQKEILKELGI